MAKQPPTLYSIAKTFFWFFVTSAILTLSLVAIVWTDYDRDWKNYQKKFNRLKIEKAKNDLKEAESKIDKTKLEELKKQAAEAERVLKAHRDDMNRLQKEAAVIEAKIAKARATYQDLKQYQDSYRYFYEEYRDKHDSRAAEYEKKLNDVTPRAASAKGALESLEKERDEKNAKLGEFTDKEKTLKKEMDQLFDEKNRITRRIEKLKPTLAKEALNAPMIDFLAPTLQIQQIQLSSLYDDYHFTKVQKVDRCTTCHQAIDQKGFSAEGGEDVPQPFRAHPKLELYLGSQSPHPVDKFGCTVCHGGNGHSVSFVDSAHTPSTSAQEEEWKKKYHWHELEKWEQKMLPKNFIEASCAKCHAGVIEVPKAEKLNRGRQLAQTYGCFNCHKVAGFENRWKVGADLTHVQSKLKENWIARWLSDPRAFRDSTKMPRIFHLSNNSSPEDADRENAAIRATAAYLMKNSEPVELAKPPVAGDAARGENLVKTVGCTGCHTVAGVSINKYAAELSGLGSKVSREWLYDWLKNPKHYIADTRMPSLRLSDQEAADIAAYLLSQKNEKFESMPLPEAKSQVVDQMILENLQGSMRRTEAEAELVKMSPDDKMQFLGKKSIAYQGCYTCHAIKGFETAKPIGAELSNEGVKDLHQFDFGFVHEIPHTRQAWLAQKLKEPRIFDRDKIRPYYERLRMPWFNFSDEQVEDLTTFLLSLTEEEMPLEMQELLDSKELETEKARLLAAKLNCTGCHTLDGKTGALRKKAEDIGQAPPTLEGEGAKVQEKWLHDFLKEPTTIRPWLTYRMPTFGFTEEELGALVHYFANLSDEPISYQGHPAPVSTPEKIQAGKNLFDKLQCAKCHQVNTENAAMGSSFLAPDLSLAKNRLKPEWVLEWLTDPQKVEVGTMMPTFFPEGETAISDVLSGNAKEQIEAIRDYLYAYQKTPEKGNQGV